MKKKTKSFAPKDRIEHSVFGTGTIVELDQWHTVIAFDEGGTRKFVTSMVKLAPSDTEPPAKPVRKKKKKTKDRWCADENGERTDVIIQWKKAYKSAEAKNVYRPE